MSKIEVRGASAQVWSRRHADDDPRSGCWQHQCRFRIEPWKLELNQNLQRRD
jgi:hypothetical protein